MDVRSDARANEQQSRQGDMRWATDRTSGRAQRRMDGHADGRTYGRQGAQTYARTFVRGNDARTYKTGLTGTTKNYPQ